MMRFPYLAGPCADFVGSNPSFVMIVGGEGNGARATIQTKRSESLLRGWTMPET